MEVPRQFHQVMKNGLSGDGVDMMFVWGIQGSIVMCGWWWRWLVGGEMGVLGSRVWQ